MLFKISCMAVCLLGLGGALASAPDGGLPRGDPPPAAAPLSVDVDVSAAANRPSPAVIVSAGTPLVVHFAGTPRATARWDFGFAGTSLAHGAFPVDEAGLGCLRLVVPDVRRRIVCELLLASDGASARRVIVVYPESLVADAAGRIREQRIGVLDPTGGVQRALRAERIAFEDLAPQIARDHFNGSIAVLAGHKDVDALADICRRLNSRVRAGTNVLVLNPPARWSAWDLGRIELDPPESAAARVAPELGSFVPAEDLGNGPWTAVLEAKLAVEVLAWYETPTQPGRGRAEGDKAARRMLIAARAVGRGRIVASLLPQTEFPDVDVVGRGLLGEMILWLIGPPAPHSQSKETNHEQSGIIVAAGGDGRICRSSCLGR